MIIRRFASSHLDQDGKNICKTESIKPAKIYVLDKSDQVNLRKKKYDFKHSDEVCQKCWDLINSAAEANNPKKDKCEAWIVTGSLDHQEYS